MKKLMKKFAWWSAVAGLMLAIVLPPLAAAQDQDQNDTQDDPPARVARLGYMEGSVSFQPAGEDEWVQAVPNRPMTTGDKLWADKGSRVEVQLDSAVIRLNENTGFSFLNLDDNTIQIQLTSGAVNVRVRQLDENSDFEVDTPNLAFSVSEPGSYRVEASEDGTYTVVSIRDGSGQSTGNGQTYTLHAGQRATFSGSDSLNADVVEIGGPDQFDNWAYARDRRYDQSRSAQYLSRDVVGYEDLDDYGDWRDDPSYGHVWFPSRVEVGWAPYHTGHWDWIEPWGYTWVDDSPWGYAPFHYGRWVTIGGRWGWIAGPVAVRPVYSPALVVFVGGVGVGIGGNVAWFPLGPREVYVPPYRVSLGYMTRVNVSNTVVNTTVITNVYRTTIINKSTTITNVTYVNRNVQGAVMAVPQRAFASAQPVARVAVRVDAREIAAAPINARVAVVPTHDAVLGARASTAGRVTAPPAAVAGRQVVAKKMPPPPPPSFAKQQQALAAHPGQPLGRSEVRTLQPANAAQAHPMVRQAPPGKPATPAMGRPGTPASAGHPAQPGGQPGNRPETPAESNRPGQPNPPPNRQGMNPQPGNRPEAAPMNNRPNQPEANRPAQPPARNDRPPAAQQNNRPENNRPENNRPENNRPENNRPENNRPPNPPPQANRPEANRPNNQPENRPAQPPANRPEANRQQPNRNEQPQRTPPAQVERPQQRTPPPAETRQPPPRQQPKAQTPEEKKQQEEKRKKEEKPPRG